MKFTDKASCMSYINSLNGDITGVLLRITLEMKRIQSEIDTSKKSQNEGLQQEIREKDEYLQMLSSLHSVIFEERLSLMNKLEREFARFEKCA